MGVQFASATFTSAAGGLVFCQPGLTPAGLDESLVSNAHSNGALSSGKTKANVVVRIIGRVVITVGRTAVPAVVDPRTATQNAVIACLTCTHWHFIPTRADVAENYVAATSRYQCLGEWRVRLHS